LPAKRLRAAELAKPDVSGRVVTVLLSVSDLISPLQRRP